MQKKMTLIESMLQIMFLELHPYKQQYPSLQNSFWPLFLNLALLSPPTLWKCNTNSYSTSLSTQVIVVLTPLN